MRVIVVGGRTFGVAAAERVRGKHEVAAVWCEESDKLEAWAHTRGLPALIEPTPEFLAGFKADLLVSAHNFLFISPRHRGATRLGAIGYHPSLLPRHRGNDAVRWTIEAGDPIAGGTVYWLDDGWDTGPVLLQKFCFVRPGDDPSSLWARDLFPMGLDLLESALDMLEEVPIRVLAKPQDEEVATFGLQSKEKV